MIFDSSLHTQKSFAPTFASLLLYPIVLPVSFKMHFSPVLVAYMAGLVAAHAGADAKTELLNRREFLSNVERSDLSHCSAKLKARGIEQRAAERRQAIAQKKSKRGIVRREASDINKTHLSEADYSLDTPLDTIFSANTSCVLSPEETEGPYCKAFHKL